MKLTFLGTRGEIEPRTPAHAMHSSLLLAHRKRRVMIDCGRDWLGRVDEIDPHAIILTHAHPDHAFGLQQGAPCPVYATEEAWQSIRKYPINDPHPIEPRQPVDIEGITFEAFPVEHSITAPAVGFRITAGAKAVFYAPDLIFIRDRADALRDARIYIGDGASMSRSFIRTRGTALIGHAPVRTQLGWCQAEGVPRAIITHCGTEIVSGDEEKLTQQLEKWAAERGITAEFAYDGLEVTLR
jgi:phosphoribosyl 1,2-cyclic phosphodiesterase